MSVCRKVEAYQKQSQTHSLIDADPHQVITVMMSAVLDNIAKARGALQRGHTEGRTQAINKATRIIGGLQDGLNMEVNPEISNNFFNLYDYMVRRLSEANLDSDISALDEVRDLLSQIFLAWKSIPEAEKVEGLRLLKAN